MLKVKNVPTIWFEMWK